MSNLLLSSSLGNFISLTLTAGILFFDYFLSLLNTATSPMPLTCPLEKGSTRNLFSTVNFYFEHEKSRNTNVAFVFRLDFPGKLRTLPLFIFS
jgi:hypothetical protein